MTRTPGITGKSFIGFCPPRSSSGSARCGAGASKGSPTATHGRVSSDSWMPWVPWAEFRLDGPPCPAAPLAAAGGHEAPEHPPGMGTGGPGCPAPVSRLCIGLVWGGDSPAAGRGTPAAASSPGEDGDSDPPACTSDPGVLDREESSRKGPGGFTLGVPAPRSPQGGGAEGVPVPTHTMGEGWTALEGGGIPCTPPSHSNPGHSTNTTWQSLMGGSPRNKCHPTAHDTQPPPQNSTQKEGGGGGTPQAPPEHTEAQQQHTARPWLRSSGGHGGLGGTGGVSHGGVLQPKCRREKHPGAHEGKRVPLAPGTVGRQWGRGAESGKGAAGAKLGPNWSPAVPVLSRRLRVRLGALGTPHPGSRRGCEGLPP